MKKNIVLLTDCLAYLTGGTERQIVELGKRLNKERFCVTIASLECEGKAPRDIIESNGCGLVTFPVKRIYGLSGLLQGFAFIRFLKKNRTDILITYHFSSDIWGGFWGRLAGVRRIVSNRRDMGFWRGRRHVQMYKIINPCVDRIIVNAQAIKTLFVREELIDASKVEVIYNGIDTSVTSCELRVDESRVGELRKELGLRADDIIIVHVANMTPVKGHRFLFEALQGVLKERSGVKLLVIGADEMDGQLQDLAKQLGIEDHILFLGERKDVGFLLGIADIGVMPSLSEGMSNAVMEYMVARKPVVATRVGGNPELVDEGVSGLLVDKEDAEGLRDALLALMEDPQKREAMGAAGYKKICEQFSMEKMVGCYEGIFDDLVPPTMKVFHLISSLGLFGAESVMLTLGQNIQGNGWRSIVGALGNMKYTKIAVMDKAREMGVETHVVACRGRFDVTSIFRLKKYLRREGIDILHTHNYKSDVIGCLAARWSGVPLVATAHGFTDMTRTVSVYEKLDRFVLKHFFDRVVTVTGRMLPDLPAPVKRVIPNGVDMARFARDEQKGAVLRKTLHITQDDVFIGTIGRFSPEKNQKILLEAVYPLMRADKRIKVLMVGDGPKMRELKNFVEARHMADRVFFPGIVEDTVAVYSALDIFVLSSLTEGVPLTVLEAMASFVPVVATRVGGIPEIIRDKETGLLVEAQDEAGLRKEIENLIGDKDKGLRMAQAAFEYVKQHHSLERMCDGYREVYGKILSS